MWQYKQEERELKRVEGDIIKNQRAVRHTLRDFENSRLFHSFLLVLYKKYTLPIHNTPIPCVTYYSFLLDILGCYHNSFYAVEYM